MCIRDSDKATGNKYADKVDKAQEAARKAVGAENPPADPRSGGAPKADPQSEDPQQGAP